jgi:peptidoglycan/xylan/chitin deacetylase (PgdA/CDA1 family)
MDLARRAGRRTGLRRATLAAERTRWERVIRSLRGTPRRRAHGRILCFHSVGTPQWGVNDVAPDRFRRHLELALDAGFRFVPAARIARDGGDADDLAITFDDGLRSVAMNAAPILAERRIPWTIFVVTEWAGRRHRFGDGMMLDWNDLERLAADGATIASHSVTHPDFARLSYAEAFRELADSRRAIAEHLGIETTEFAIPFGRSTNWSSDARAAAADAGYDLVYAQSEDRRPEGTVGRTFVTRFDGDRLFRSALGGAFDATEEFV